VSPNANVAGRLDTGTSFILDLISDIKKGVVKIPQFQRRFVWKEKQALDLLDSIANNYPVGSVLLWRTHSRLAVERNIGDFRLPETDDQWPTDYVLDGQQRITVIYSCLGAAPADGGFAAGYDLDAEEFVQLPADGRNAVFPMRLLFTASGTELLNFRTGLQASASVATYLPRLDALVTTFSRYRLPVVVLKELSVEEVCPIFERINSSGTKLSIFDLMVAATWSPTFDLNDIAARIATALEGKGFDKIESTTVLKCLTAVQTAGLKRDQMLGLRELNEDEMKQLVDMTTAALLRTVDLLYTEFKVFSWDFLPYEAMLIVLCYVCSRVDTMERTHVARLRVWFWRSALNERYRVGGEGFVTRDLERVRGFVLNGERADDFGQPLSAAHILHTDFRSANSRSRAFASALATASPRNITNGAVIDTALALSQFNRKQFHHVYPKAYLARGDGGQAQQTNSLANICMLAAQENNIVSDSDPNEYLPRLAAGLGAEANDVFLSNLLPLPSNLDYSTATFADFAAARSEMVADYLARLCGVR
jgi:hypothetical protein